MKRSLHLKLLEKLLLFALFMTTAVSWSQMFSENMGTPGGTTSIVSNSFQNASNFTYTGTADVRSTTTSSGYTGSSGGGNVFFTSSDRFFQISNINTTGFTNLALSFGHYKNTTAGGTELLVEVSSDGTTFTPLTYSRSSGSGTTGWVLINASGTIPATANLRIRFTSASSSIQFRLDDVKLTGTVSATPVITVGGSIAAQTTTYGTAAPFGTFTVSGSDISASTGITVTAPAGFEVSQTGGGASGYAATQNVGAAGAVATKTLYVRLAAATAPGNYGGNNIVITSSGATQKTVPVAASTVDKKVLTITGITATKVYNGTNTATLSGATLSGIVSGDASLVALGTYTATYNDATAGTNKPLTITYNLTGSRAARYTLTQPTGFTGTITQKALTLTGGTAANKVYDGTTADAVITVNPALTGVVGSDDVLLSGTPTASFSVAAVGSHPISITGGYTLTGSSAANYTLTLPQQVAGLSAEITAKELTIGGISVADKNFDGTTAATVTGTAELVGVAPADAANVVLSGTPVAEFASASVGSHLVTITGYTISGTAIANYTLIQPQGIIANIVDTGLESQTITFNALNAVTYGDANLTLTATANSGLPVSYTSSNEDVATISGSTVTITGVGTATITAIQQGDATHNPAPSVQQDLVVNKKTLTVNNAGVITKVYNGNEDAVLTGTLEGVVGNDDVVLTSFGLFASADAGIGIEVLSDYIISGADVANYTLTQPEGLTGVITPKELTLSNAVAQSKVYDGTTTAVVTGQLSGIVMGDTVAFTGTSAFAYADAGTAVSVSTSLTLTGADAANYTLTQPTGVTANITPKPIMVSAVAASKQYDATVNTTVNGGTVSSGIIEGDVVTVAETSVTGEFVTPDAGTAKPVTAAFSLAGTDAGNYSIAPQTYPADITPRALTVDVTNATATKIYDGTFTAIVNGAVLSGVLGDDQVTASTGTYTTKNVGTGITVTIALAGADAANYTVTQPIPALTGIITKKELIVKADNKTVNKNAAMPAFTVSFTGFVPGESTANIAEVPVASTTVTNTQVAGAYPITLTPGEAENYTLTLVNGTFIINDIQDAPVPGASDISLWSNSINDNNPSSANPYTSGQVFNTTYIASVSGIGRGSGIAGNAGNGRYNSVGWTTETAIDANDYFYFTIAPKTSPTPYKINFTTINGSFQSSNNGPTSYTIKSSLDNYNSVIAEGTIANGNFSIPLTQVQGVSGSVQFRLYAYGAVTTSGTFSLDDLNLKGTVTQLTSTPGTAPVITSAATINTVAGVAGTYQITASGTPVISGLNAVGTNASGSTTTALPAGVTVNTTSGLVSYDGTTPAGTYYLKVSATNYYGTGTRVVTYTVTAAPALVVTPNPINTLHAYQGQAGSATAVQLQSITGTNLTPASGNITITASTGFVVSINNGVSYGTSFTFPYSGGALNIQNPEIFVRLASGLTVGAYNGTLTLTGGSATGTVQLYGVVETAPAIRTIAANFGPYCQNNTNAAVQLAFTSEGTIPNGGYYIQYSDATGIFPATFTNIVSAAPATSSPVSATLPNLPVGNYLLRVVHLSEGLTLTVSTDDANGNGADNGSFVSVKALPTLSGVQATSVCAGNDSQITFSGLLPSTEVMVNYTVGGSANNVTVTADVAGTASFALLLDNATNGQVFTATSIARTDVTPSCTSTFNISTTLSVAANTWLGTTTVWNEAANWSCGNVPTAADNVVIAQTANQPIVSGDITAFANNLTANAGALLTVQSGNVLTVRNAVNVTSGGEIVFENNAHLMQDTNAVANANSGTVEVNRNSSLLFRQDYTMWSSPVAGQNLRDFSPETVLSRFYSYNTATDHYESIFITEQAADNVNFATGTGYLVRMPNGAPQAGYVEGTTAIKFAGQFTGTPHNGTIATAVTPQAGDLDGFNAIGNPYPSPISIPAFFAGNEGNTDGTIYLWRKKNGVDVQSAYCTVNADGDFVSNLQAGSESPNGILQTGQGFIVKALTSTVNFTNAMRSATTTQDDSFFRMNNSAPVTAESHRIWLNLSKDATPVAQMLVGYKSNATMGIDTGIDALFMNDVSTGLNSVIEGNAYAIQGRSLPFDNTDVVPLQFKAQAAGNYSVAIDHVDGLFADGQDIFLKDNLLNVTHDIKASSYSFTSDAGVFDNRFEMVYINTALGNEEVVLNPKSIIIYKQDRNLVVNAGSEIISEVKVFDTRGRMIYNNDSINSNETVVSGLRAEEQVLIVQVTTVEKGVVSKKIIF